VISAYARGADSYREGRPELWCQGRAWPLCGCWRRKTHASVGVTANVAAAVSAGRGVASSRWRGGARLEGERTQQGGNRGGSATCTAPRRGGHDEESW